MKGLDTPALLALLHDSTAGRELLKTLRGEEVATTELNLFELRTLAALSGKDRPSRENALARLRRRLTVLPITGDGVNESTRFVRSVGRAGVLPLIWGTMASAGCSEWITTRPYAPPKGPHPFRVGLIT